MVLKSCNKKKKKLGNSKSGAGVRRTTTATALKTYGNPQMFYEKLFYSDEAQSVPNLYSNWQLLVLVLKMFSSTLDRGGQEDFSTTLPARCPGACASPPPNPPATYATDRDVFS